MNRLPRSFGLYRDSFEHDACGFGLIADRSDRPSHRLVQIALRALERMTHRGAVGADEKTGDGCGILLKKPERFLQAIAADCGFKLAERYAVGSVFLSREATKADRARTCLERELHRLGLEPLGWREVPINPERLGEQARSTLPRIEQLFVNAPAGMDGMAFERRLFIARRRTEKQLSDDDDFYVASLSPNLLSYKALVIPEDLPRFYLDLQREDLAASLAVFHQRFSTNTLPRWPLAQPFRYLAHNGEINTIQGNRNWARTRTHILKSPHLPDLTEFDPIVSLTGSDSQTLDNMFEILRMGGLDLFQAMRLIIPPAWQNVEHMDPDLRAFYEFHSMHMEPWDGPAGIVLSDGRFASCILDRNGLRPARFWATKDGLVTLASEIGVYDYDEADVELKGRLKPGQMMAADTVSGKLYLPEDIDLELKRRKPYRRWLQEHARRLDALAEERLVSKPLDPERLKVCQKQFLVTFEEREEILKPMALQGQEPVGSMGDDTPLPALSTRVRSLYDSFRQQFAQVTNPPIDPIRESIVMSLETCLGPQRNLFEEEETHAKRVVLDTPVLTERRFQEILALGDRDPLFRHRVIDLNRPLGQPLKEMVLEIASEAEAAARDGITLIVLSDRGISKEKLPVHALLAVGAVHHRLIEKGLRCRVNLIVETALARNPHHFACLIGYGATAVYPYLAYGVLRDMLARGEIKGKDEEQVVRNFVKAQDKGLLKILSKMGISAISSYRGAQLFEIVGLGEEVVDLCFRGTTSRIGGMDFEDLERDLRELHFEAWNRRKPLRQGGWLKFVHGGEDHAFNPDVVQSLHRAVVTGRYEDWEAHAQIINERRPLALRDLLRLKLAARPLPLSEVEPVEEIVKRFDSAAMSLGALSPEAHETLAEAMNRLGARSNSGEGGEDPSRYGTLKNSKIKQIASGRFGVTPHYLTSAEVIQIKIAQGAKPGEGGQLPGHKVNGMIARLRYSVPGVALISPPPHHDIYSIEDLAQLIYDLKEVNPKALVSVKLVAEAGVGTIAAGVAKAYADLITISGHDGGTGASPITSIKYAGVPWELGLAEAHQVLKANGLRSRVRLQTDGGLKTGLDVVKAAILGAESFGFGTGPMVAMGCKYLRICHLNNCATGVATQEKVLRMEHFVGTVERVMRYFRFIAEEARRWMALLGVRTVEELVGRYDLLEPIEGFTKKQRKLHLWPILTDIAPKAGNTCCVPVNIPWRRSRLADRMERDILPAIQQKRGGEFFYEIQNTDRAIGTRLAGEIARRYGNGGMRERPIVIRFRGTAGQSFGAFLAGGLHLYLEGDANDYVGKGMADGKIVIYPPAQSGLPTHKTPIMGNTCLYGATGGKLFASGVAGERFAVRNSGAVAVVEGVGDHGCEYMTRGVVVVLGQTGLNFGAGMTGGLAFVLDEEGGFSDRYNHELVEIHRLAPVQMEPYQEYLRGLIEEFVSETGSPRGREILSDWNYWLEQFWIVKPKAMELDELMHQLQDAA